MSNLSQSTQAFFSAPMAYEVDYTNNLPRTEEKKMDTMWLNLLNAQANYCLGLLAHVQTSICASQRVKASIMIHLGHVMADVRKGLIR